MITKRGDTYYIYKRVPKIAGNTPGAHIIEGYAEVSGIKFPTKRRIYARQPDGSFSTDPLVVSIDLSNIHLS